MKKNVFFIIINVLLAQTLVAGMMVSLIRENPDWVLWFLTNFAGLLIHTSYILSKSIKSELRDENKKLKMMIKRLLSRIKNNEK